MTITTIERRLWHSTVECRSDGEQPKFVGYAAVFDTDSEPIMGLFVERIARGAFAETLRDDVRALVNHDPNFVLGRTLANTLTMREDARGLYVEILPPNTTYAHDLLESVRRGDVSQMSFAFQTLDEEMIRGTNGALDIRILKKVRLYDVSLVTFPAYPDTTVAVRMHERFRAQSYEDDIQLRERRLRLEIA